jgi:hypothetical protein
MIGTLPNGTMVFFKLGRCVRCGGITLKQWQAHHKTLEMMAVSIQYVIKRGQDCDGAYEKCVYSVFQKDRKMALLCWCVCYK